MATTRQFPPHDRVLEGVDTTLPAHLIGQQWRVQHMMRLTPELVQVPYKVVNSRQIPSSETVMAAATLASNRDGVVRNLFLCQSQVTGFDSTLYTSGLPAPDPYLKYQRWSYFVYDNRLYYTNESTGIRVNDVSSDAPLVPNLAPGSVGLGGVQSNPKAKYILMWYDHIVAAYGTRLHMSDLYDFTKWIPDNANEADFYDFVEWQQPDYPFFGITGIGRIGATLWVYTPTAIIPVRYVGKPKVFNVEDTGVISRFGNTMPWTLVTMAQAHFFYDAVEHMFFMFDGRNAPQPIGEPIRGYIKSHLHGNLEWQSRMFGYVDVDNREIWWNFISNESEQPAPGVPPPHDKSVVFNYRYGKWFTASNENVQCFVGATNPAFAVDDLVGAISDQGGPIGQLGHGATGEPRLFGTTGGKLLREEVSQDSVEVLLSADDPVLESADFHYNDLFSVKEVDAMVINAMWTPAWTAVYLTDENGNYILANGKRVIIKYVPYEGHDDGGRIELKVRGRTYLGENVVWTESDVVGLWHTQLPWSKLDFPPKSGIVMRYRFTGTRLRRLIFSAYADGVRIARAEL